MKRFLPIVFLFIFLFFPVVAYAVDPTETPTVAPTATLTPTPDPGTNAAVAVQPIPGCIGGSNDTWKCDEEVTFMGKSASRSKDFLNWTMAHYRWAEWKEDNPIGLFWARIRNIMYGLLFLFVLVTGFILVITRGKSITVMKFIPRFVFILIFATLSFAIVQFLYQISDIVMGFFLQGPGLRPDTIDPTLKVISGNNLFYIGWEYQDFIGYRLNDASAGEAAFMSILLIKLTSITFYIMAILLLIRKVILWLFIAVSPVFPFLLLYYPIRNTGKIWVGEFFRWLLYGPLFAVFLYGLVALWQFQPPGAVQNSVGIPLNFDTTKAGQQQFIKYPTAINIVIGGPGQTISRENNVNLPDTFVLYVFALIMVWVVTFFPFVLLRIFLDHMNNMLSNENWMTRQLGKTPFGRPPSTPPGPIKPVMPAGPIIPPPPPSPQGAPTGMAKQMPTGSAIRPMDSAVNQQILKTANLSVPTLRDIARMETATISSTTATNTATNASITREITRTQQSLEKIANPAATTNSVERSQYTMVREKLTQESQSGNLFAKSVLNAANTMSSASVPQQRVTEVMHKVANPTVVLVPAEKQQYTQLHQKVVDASKKGDSLAQSILDSTASASSLEKAKERGDQVAAAVLSAIEQQSLQQAKLPTVNRVQAVSLDDYEAVKKMWKENYKKLEPPAGQDRNAWIQKDAQKISDTINLLSSTDPEKEKQGMQMVSNILPFLMIGGFSKTEVVAYLKAKQEAGKDILEQIKVTDEDEESKLEVTHTQAVNRKTLHAEETEQQPQHVTSFSSNGSFDDDGDVESPLATMKKTTIHIQIPPVILQTLQTVKIAIPNLREVAQIESASEQVMQQKTASLEKIANPTITTDQERSQYDTARKTLVEESKKGDVYASTILAAAQNSSLVEHVLTPEALQTCLTNIANVATITNEQEKVQYTTLEQTIRQESQKGNPLAAMLFQLLGNKQIDSTQLQNMVTKVAEDKTNPVAQALAATIQNQEAQLIQGVSPESPLPETNRIQSVSLDDYEAVKQLWTENYKKLDPPAGIHRQDWIMGDEQYIQETINLLSSKDPQMIKQGMQRVGKILPFLMIGGFSKTEIITYLKAKQEAGKSILTQATGSDEEKIGVEAAPKTEQKTMTIEAEEERAPKELEDSPKNPGGTNTNTPV